METGNSSGQKKAGRNRADRSEVGQTLGVSDLLSGEPGEEVLRGLSRDNVAFWKPRLRKRVFRTRTGKAREVPDWQVKFGHEGRQRWVNLGTPNRDAAAKKARDKWQLLQAKGWAALIADREGRVEVPTVGQYLEAVQASGAVSAATFEIYAAKFRRLVAGCCGIRGGKERFNYRDKGNARWRERVHAVKLRRLTATLFRRWQVKHLRKFAGNPVKQEKARVSLNSLLRSASALFAEKVRAKLPHLNLPEALPFVDVERPQVRVARYVSKIEPALLFQQAQRELADPEEATLAAEIRERLTAAEAKRKDEKPRAVTEKWVTALLEEERARRRQMFLVFCLALFAGLRRDEIDTLTWKQIDFGRGTIHVQTTEHGRVKSYGSDRVVDIGTGLAEILRRAMQGSASEFVIAGDVKARPEAATYHHYRRDRLMDRLVKWLKAHGVESQNALHTLRKEFGTQINLAHGIFAASAALGHSSIQLTRAVYVAKKAPAVFDVPTTNLSVVPDAGGVSAG